MSVEIRVGELARIVGGRIVGDPNTVVTGVAGIGEAVAGDIVFAESDRHLAMAMASPATAVVVAESATDKADGKPLIVSDNPRLAFAKIIEVFAPVRHMEEGVHALASVSSSAKLGANVRIGAYAFVGPDVVIGDDTTLMPYVYAAPGVRIGSGCMIFPHVTVLDDVVLGDRVRIHSGAVIGSDGFGFVCVDGEHYKIPQIGGVRIGDDVEIGANVTIDRARTGVTRIGAGTKIDNLVHVAHNVKIGRNCVIVAGVAIGGSATIGDGATIAGQAGVRDHTKVGNGARLAARTGAMQDVGPGETVAGFPARPITEHLKSMAALNRLPEALRRFREMEARIAVLEERQRDDAGDPTKDTTGADTH